MTHSGPVIDAHTHLLAPESVFSATMDGSVETLLRSMDEAGVERAVTFVVAPYDRNEIVADACRRHPDRLIGFAGVDPRETADGGAEEYVDKLLDLYPFTGVKVHPRLTGFSFNDERHLPLWAALAARGLPVLTDCATTVSNAPYADNVPFEMDRAIRQVPDLRLIIAHMGGSRVLDAYAMAMHDPRVFLDLSWLLDLYEGSSVEADARWAITRLAPRRKLIWGSDHPSEGNRPISVMKDRWLELLDELGVADDDVAAIMGGTVADLLDLEAAS